jgi:hypothetical protein
MPLDAAPAEEKNPGAIHQATGASKILLTSVKTPLNLGLRQFAAAHFWEESKIWPIGDQGTIPHWKRGNAPAAENCAFKIQGIEFRRKEFEQS